MVSIIKNQLLKHLSRFTKNLSADKINLSTFKGEGELSNLELDEIVLTDLLELPSWLRLTRAWCNRVQFRISWTKLKTVPIYLNLDEVNIIVETCEELRSLSSPTTTQSAVGVPGKYSFIHKVIDGITIAVNTVNVTFNSPAFTASVQISRILVESKSTSWQRSDLRMTRLKDSEKGQILIFKELEWQTVRIEAKSTKDKDLTPLRLLTNHARCRITIKKRLSDCFIMGSRLVLILDDLLWVLTDSQLKAALHFLDSLADLVAKATEVTRKQKAARKLEVLPEYQAQKAQQARTSETSAISKIFSRYDVVETSYHFVSQHIVLHLCDDPGDGRSSHPDLKDGGALQISCHGFQVDYYPYHLAMGDRKHWPRYKEGSVPHTQWLDQSLNSFRSKFIDLIDKNRSQHVPLTRSPQQQQQQQTPTPVNKLNDNQINPTSGVSPEAAKKPVNTVKNYVLKQLPKLMTTCIIMRIEDFTLYRVTTSGKKQALKEFISGDREHISLPEETNIVHAEFTYYYYPGDIPFPLPPPKFYVQLNPIQINFDIDSCLWFNSFALNLHQSLISSKANAGAQVMPYIDVKIEAILPRVILESNVDHHGQRDRPKSLHVQVTRATITNVRSLEHSSRADLAKCVDSFHMGSLFFGSEFPSQQNDYYIVTQKFLDHIAATDNVRSLPEFASTKALPEQFSQELLWTEAKDVWCVNLDPVWADFYGAKSVGSNRPIPFLDAVPVTVWIHLNLDTKPMSNPKTADIHALAYISNLVSVQLNHYQYLFLLRMAEDVSELATFLAIDSNRILKQDSSKSIAVGALIPQVEVTFVMPSQCPGKETSGGDLESVLPDSSSIGDDILVGTGSGTTLWQQSIAVNEVFSQQQQQQQQQQSEVVRKTEVVFCEQEISYPTLPIMPEQMATTTTTNTNKMAANGGTTTTNTKTTPQSSQPFPNIIPNNFNASLSTMKKGFSSLMTSIDSALKSSPDDISDTLSIRSDASSDSENYVVVNLESGERNVEAMEAMFRVQGVTYDAPPRATVVEMASEVIEDDNSATTPSEHSLASTYKRRDLVSVSTFKLSKVEFLQQSIGFNSNLKIQVSNVVNDECGAIPWDEFQSKFSSRSRAWVDIPANSNTSTKVKLRLDHDVIESQLASINTINVSNKNDLLRKLFKDTLNIQINDIDLDLNMSTVTGLTDLIEDEIIPVQIPMQISLDNIQLHLIEDRPPSNITSPGPIPIDLTLKQLFINKDMDGVFHITPLTSNLISSSSSSMSIKEEKERERELQILQQTVKNLKTDSDELKRRLAAFDRISEENRQLRKTKEEADILRACLTSAQDDIAKLIEDKKTLLDNLQRMEEHFRQTERSRQWTAKR